ncbi:hypothetical protein TIFTF001_055217 [Ficus carica]|uniref:Terpene synthase metal-binding domain-containing protein n=1 Tax=Ficus carica TaxID=3494 RepID=A0AA88ELE7_FICCA|nr:hypothetical protein TIFTF001_055217 [Ficus carica]
MKKQIQAYFDEAKWLNEKNVPTLEEHMQLATVSCGYGMLIITSFLGMGDIATEEVFEWATKYPKIVKAACVINRLMSDIAGHKFEQKREHIVSSVECYVKQYGVSEQEAYTVLRQQINDAWKDINEECLEPREMAMPLLMRVVNFARVIDLLYKDGDNYTNAGGIMKHLIKSIFIDPIPM